MQVTMAVLSGQRPPQPTEERGLTDEFWSLIEDCWATKPGDRPNMTTIVSRIRSIIASSPPADSVEHQAESSDSDIMESCDSDMD